MTATSSLAATTSFRLAKAAAALTLGLLLILVFAGQAKAAAFGFAAAPAAPGLSSNCQAGSGDDRLKVTCAFSNAHDAAISVGPNVSSADVHAVGHAGGTPANGSFVFAGTGGAGGDVTGRIGFAAGTGTLYVNVGELADGYVENDRTPWSFGGGAPFGGCEHYQCYVGRMPGGGGASDVRTVPAGQAGTLETRLIVGGGGGGGGGDYNGRGANGGDAGQPGGSTGNGGGGAGTQSAGGAGGITAVQPNYNQYPSFDPTQNGDSGSLGNGGQGGHGMNVSYNIGGAGGGGGGGYYGGGGGGGNGDNGGGGGGGSNLVPANGISATATTPARVTVDYERAATTTTVSSSAPSSVYGSDITLTAAVRSDTGALDGGTVQFYDGAAVLGQPQTVDPLTGDATLTGRLPAGGAHSLTAVYSGDGGYAPSSSTDAPLAHSVSADTSTTSLTVSAQASMYSTPATLTAAVAATSGAPAAANGGQVQFYDGDSKLSGPVSVAGGEASLSLQGLLSAGEHTLHAVYEGDASTTTSESSTVAHSAQREPTYSDLRSYTYSVNYGQMVSLQGSVRSRYGYQSFDQYLQRLGYQSDPGTVKLYDDGQLVTGGYQSPLYYGASYLSFYTTPVTGGMHNYTIKFSGNDAFEASESYSYQSRVYVTNVPSTTTLTSTRTTSYLGQERTFSSEVAVADGSAPSGTVQFTDNGSPLGAAQPVGGDGQVSMTTSQLGLGEHSIRAVYTPSDYSYLSSTSDAVAQPVAKLTTSTTATVTPERVRIGQALTLDAAVAVQDAPTSGPGSEAPTGMVTFSDGRTELGSRPLGADGRAELDIPGGLTVGGHVITVAYSGDTNHTASSQDPTVLFVHRVGTSVALTLPDTDGEQFTFRAELTPDTYDSGATPTGDVAFYDGDTLLGRVALTGATAGSPGSAELQLSALAVGGHAILAVYDGDEQFAGDQSARSLVIAEPPPEPEVERVGTRLTLTLPDIEGDHFTFRAELAPQTFGAATPTGDIAFYDGDTLLGRAPLTGATAGSPGVAELALPALAAGGHAIQAVYDGDAQFEGDRSSARSIVVSAPAPEPTPTPDPVAPVVPPVVPVTPVAPVVPKPVVPTPAPVRSGHIEIMSERRVLDGSYIVVRVYCDGSPRRLCVGRLAARVGTRNAVSSDYRLAGGQARSVRIRVPASLLARVRRDGAAPALVDANPTRQANDGSEPRSVRKRIVIVASDD